MAEQSAVPLIVLSRQQDHVETINSTMRNAGHAVHCSWIRDLGELGDALTQIPAQMLIAHVGADADEASAVLDVRDQCAAGLPVVLMRDTVDEETIAEAMRLGARDVVTPAHRERLGAVIARELESHRLRQALAVAGDSARLYREQLQTFLAGSADAIAQVQEGIVVDANPAWLELFGYPDAEAILGQPLMDMFDPESHVALKGALIACLQSRWPTEQRLRSTGLLSDGSAIPLEIGLSRTDYDEEPAVRLCIESRRHDPRALEQQLSDAIERDGTSGLLQRRYFVSRLAEHLTRPLKGGIRQLVAVQLDKFAALEVEVGPVGIEDLVAQFAELLREHLQPGDLAGRFGDGCIVALLERGTPRDIEAWAAGLIRRAAVHVFRVADQSITATCSVGVGLIDARKGDALNGLTDALRARRRAEDAGGGRVCVLDHTEDDTRRLAADKVWVGQIKSALMDNRFRLVQQPIASLLGEDARMFDVLLRMIDEQGDEVLPSEFMLAAERNDLMKNIDRWVIAAAIAFSANRDVGRLFIRLSRDSVKDSSLVKWLTSQLHSSRGDPARLVFQIGEGVAAQQLAETTGLAGELRAQGFGFAVEHLGSGRDPARLIAHVPLDFIKIDGSLMQGLAGDPALQSKVRGLVSEARARQIATIAERVEDANTMAVLWQLGVEFIQGYFVHEPERVVIG